MERTRKDSRKTKDEVMDEVMAMSNTYTTLSGVCAACLEPCTAYVNRVGMILSECCDNDADPGDGSRFKLEDFAYDPH